MWLCFLIAILFSPAALRAGELRPGWEVKWERVLDEAKKAGEVVIYRTRGPFEKLFEEFNKRYPWIKVTSVTGRGGDLSSRIMAERRAGKYLADMYLGSAGTPLDVFYPAKILETVQPFLILPEVVDKSRWFQRQHHYADPEHKYIFVFEGVVRSDMAYNTTVVDPKEFTSYWDLLKPKWKGRILAMDPRLPGFPSGLLQFSYYHPDLGAEFLRRLFGEMEITLTREARQLVDWLAVGRFAIGLAPPAGDLQAAMRQGLPLARFEPRAFKEGIYMRATQGSLNIMNRTPHPQATKVFVNWLLSQEGQSHFQTLFLRIDSGFSLREDVPIDPALQTHRPKPGEKFMPVYRAEFRNLRGAFKVIEEALRK